MQVDVQTHTEEKIVGEYSVDKSCTKYFNVNNIIDRYILFNLTKS